MVPVVAFILILCIVYVIVIVGAVAYQLTGLDWDTAQFQALSAFTGVGFTTRVSEVVVNTQARRRITMTLIVSGYAATAGVIATLVSTLAYHTALETAINLAAVVATIGGAFWLLRNRGLHLRLIDPIRRALTPRIGHERVPHEELLQYRRGFGITRVEVPRGSRLAGRALKDADLRAFNLTVLAIESRGDVQTIPSAESRILEGDHLILYGKISQVQEAFFPDEQQGSATSG